MTINSNSSTTTGGGCQVFVVYGVDNLSNLTIENGSVGHSSFSFTSSGGGISNYNFSTLTLSNATVVGGSISNYGTLTLQNTIVPNVGSFSGSYNVTSGSPDLNALASNGGPTQTMSEQAGSPALGQGGAVTTVGSGITSSTATTISVSTAGAIAITPGAYLIRIDSEDLLVTNVNLSNNTLSVVRGYNGTTPATHAAGAGVYFLTDQRGDAYSTYTPDIGAYQSSGVVPGTPTVTAVNPTSGPVAGGTTVTITGTNLANATAVRFGALAGTIVSDSGTQIVAITPAESAGTVATTVTTVGWDTSAPAAANQFTFAPAGVSNPLEGPGAGSDSDIVAIVGPWTATSNSSWLHTTASGNGNGVVTFSFAANTGPTRTGTLTIGTLTLPVTQAGSNYVGVNPLLTPVSSGLKMPADVAVDSADNAYFADTGDNAIKEWNAQTGKLITLVSSGLSKPAGVAVDGSGNAYIADTGDNAVKEWNATTGMVTNLVSSGLSKPAGVAVDTSGNVYIADTGDNAIQEWNSAIGFVTTLVASGLLHPEGVAVDYVGNVYIADTGDKAVKEYNAATTQVTPLDSTGLTLPTGVAVDGGGNVFIADAGKHAIDEWSVLTGKVTSVLSGLANPMGVAVDVADNVYVADTSANTFKVLASALVPASPIEEGAAAGTDALAVVLPTTQVLTGDFAPTSNASWLKIGTVANGVIPFSFTANTTGKARTTHITVLGQSITVTQASTQTITFAQPKAVTFGVAPITLSASASSKLPVTFSVLSGPGTISGNKLTITGAGAIVIQASQAGNDNYNPATVVTQTLTVHQAALIVAAANTTWTAGQAGSYVIDITQGTLVTPANYTLTYRKGTLRVH